MKYCNPIEVFLIKSPFKKEREILEVQKDSFIKIHRELKLEFPINYYIFLDGDEIIKDYSQVPKNDRIYIKCVPQGGGGGDFKKEGTGLKISGGALVIAGVLLTVFTAGIGATVGVSLITTGIVTFASGVYLYNYELETDSYSNINRAKTQNTPSIRGSKNSSNAGGKIPVLLGRHLIVPFVASNYFTSNVEQSRSPLSESTKYQYLHLLLCSGYASMSIDTSTIKFGDIPISAYSGVNYDILESGTQNSYFPQRVIQETVNVKLERQNAIGGTDNVIIRTTPTNTKLAKVTVLFPNGLYFMSNEGQLAPFHAAFILEWKNVNDPDFAYQKFEANFSFEGDSWTLISGVMNYTCRATFAVEFSDSNVNKQYTIRVRRREAGQVSANVSDVCYWEDLKSYTKDASGNTDPIESTIKSNLNVLSFRVRATDQLSGVIDNVNYEATAYSRVYSGSGSGSAQWSSGLTSNPASAFLKILTDPLINKNPIASADENSRIDFESLEEWYTFCETKGFECNVYEVGETTVKDVLSNICSTARASWTIIDNKYSVIIDTYKPDIIQYFTPRNTYNFSASKVFYETPTCFKIAYIDKDNGYIEASRYVYYDTYNGDPRSSDIVEEVNMYGAMDADHVWKLGKYMHAVTRLRPEIFTFSTDIEYIMCTRGDRIKLNHDVPLFGLDNGRIISAIESGGNTQGFVSDETIQFEESKNYAVTIRKQDGTSVTKNVVNPEIDTNSILFDTEITGVSVLLEDDLFMFGEQGSVDVDLIVESIVPNEDLGAVITCVEYNEAIYTADSGTIPAYDPKISKGGGSALSVGTLPESQDDKVSQNQNIVTLTDQITYSLSAAYPDNFQGTTDIGWHPSTFDDFNYIYINYSQGNIIYKKTLLGDENGGALNSVSSDYPTVLGDYIYYINKEDGDALYQKGKDSVGNGSEFASNPIYKFIIDYDAEDIYYINSGDNNYIYKIANGSSGNGSLFLNKSVGDLGIIGTTLFYTNQSDSYIYYIDISDTLTENVFYSAGIVQEFFISQTGYVFYLKSDDFIIYRKSTNDFGTETEDGEPICGVATGFGVTYRGDVIFSSPVYSGYLFVGLSTASIKNATLESTATAFTLTGSISSGSSVITGISIDDLDQVVVKDRLVHVGIPEDTFIQMKGNNFLYMTNPATVTFVDASINVYGSRITLNANRVIIPGTVTAELLEANAINSKAVTTSGYHITDFDLDSGNIRIRKPDDTIVFDFNASSGDLTFSGNLSAAGGTFTGDLEITSDDAGRHLSIGSEGLYVEDASGTVIHDLPDETIISGYYPLGHLYCNSYSEGSIDLLWIISHPNYNIWYTLTVSNKGNSNVKGVMVSINIASANPHTVYLKPANVPDTATILPAYYIWPNGGGSTMTAIVPVYNDQFKINVGYDYDFISVSQIGLYI
jgi:hypothetical protein